MTAANRRHTGHSPAPAPLGGTTGQILGIAAALALVGALAYFLAGTRGVFIFDSTAQIESNARITDGSIGQILRESRRPVMEITMLWNANMGRRAGSDALRFEVFRFTNVLIHVLAGLALFGVVRRSMVLPRMPEMIRTRALWLAGAVSLIWLVHPLQTQSVAYTIQRAESMMALFYLLTMYCTLRAASSPSKAIAWMVLAMLSAGLGMGSKAVMVTVPVAVLLFDRCVITGSFKESLRSRWVMYSGLAASWLLLLAMGIVQSLAQTEPTGTVPPTVGFGVEGFTPTTYLLTQTEVILHYIRLAFVPTPLVLDYDWPAAESFGSVIPQLLIMAVLGLSTLYLLWKKPAVGFVAAFFFIVLSPTSSVIPIADAAFEHRMYLPLASIVVLVVVGLVMLVDRMATAEPSRASMVRTGAVIAVLAVSLVFMVLTVMRVNDYDSRIRMWTDVVAKRPDNARAHRALADSLLESDRPEEALPHVIRMAELEPDEWFYQYQLAGQLAAAGRIDDAEVHYRAASEQSGDDIRPLVDLGIQLSKQNVARYDDSFEVFETAIARGDAEKNPGRMYKAWFNYGIALYRKGVYRPGSSRVELLNDALSKYERALEIRPNRVNIHVAAGIAHEQLGNAAAAKAEYEAALEKQPGYLDAMRRLQALNGR